MSFFRTWLFVAWLIYLILPLDLVPDFTGVGIVEDFLILLVVYLLWGKRGIGMYRQAKGRRQAGGYGYGQGSRAGNGNAGSRNAGEQGSTGNNGGGSEPKDPYRILGIDRTASLEDVKHAWRTQANRYHPDKVSHLGEEFEVLANQKFKDIQWAYDEILKQRGQSRS